MLPVLSSLMSGRLCVVAANYNTKYIVLIAINKKKKKKRFEV